MASVLNQAEVERFHADGLVFVRGLFDPEETALLRRAMEEDPQVRDHMLDRLDANGAATRIALWNRAGDSVYGLAARCARDSRLNRVGLATISATSRASSRPGSSHRDCSTNWSGSAT